MRVRRDRSNPETLDNPRIFGTDVGNTAESVAGLVVTAVINDKLLSPLVRGFTSGIRSANNTVGQLVDAATTLFAAQLVGMAAGKLVGGAAAARMAQGGGLYGIGKAVTALIPGVSISAQYPDFFPALSLFGPTTPTSLPAGSTVAGVIAPSTAASMADSIGF
jgi:hypothetical protein